MRLDTPLDSPFSATLSVHGLHFTVCAPSKQGLGTPFVRTKGRGSRLLLLDSSLEHSGAICSLLSSSSVCLLQLLCETRLAPLGWLWQVLQLCLSRHSTPTRRFQPLDGPAIRNANWAMRESIRANRFRKKKKKKPIFITCERFARIASNLRFAGFGPPKRDSQKQGFSSGTLKRFARIR